MNLDVNEDSLIGVNNCIEESKVMRSPTIV